MLTNEILPNIVYIQKFVSEEQQDKIINFIDEQDWSTSLKRRVQQYGFDYDYGKKSVETSNPSRELPDWSLSILKQLEENQFFIQKPYQLIVNEYQPGQGISSHIDRVSCFGDLIVSISLCSACVMTFTHIQSMIKVPILLEPCSLLVLEGATRYNWKHGISPRKFDVYSGLKFERKRRLSLTFRSVIK